ncbi:tyrosine-type recombinase/integrase [Rheinheimera soli]|uniref:Integrase/recombinase XerD n=1 Tax=Rheinheimera soli TaxID=443616 RepID=A0ABU1W548_9GAMM|nr:tyrosine-type recombinase/integrase [Rheinheimera soli]MDR7123096.1 integrase/recombinase XerD [Rheinheimera soli]
MQPLIKPDNGDIDDCIRYYLQLCLAKGQSSETVASKQNGLSLFMRWLTPSGDRQLSDITLDMMDRYQLYLHSYRHPVHGRPLSRGTQRNRLTVVKVFMHSMYIKGCMEHPTLERFELPSPGYRLPKAVFSEPEIEAMLKQTLVYGELGVRDRAILETYYATGIRRGELSRLTLDDVDHVGHVLRVEQGKGNKDRFVPIAPRACDWITSYLQSTRPRLAAVHSGRMLFLDSTGYAIKPRRLSALAAKYVRLAGIGKRGACNLYRHTTATLMLEYGADIRHVQEMLGHASISTTQVYTHVAIGKLKDVYAKTHPAARGKPGKNPQLTKPQGAR